MAALTKVPPGGLGVLRPNSITELDIFAQRAAASGMVPETYKGKPGAIFIAVQFGSELGLSPMQSLVNIAVVGGRPTVFGDAMPGLCKQSPVCEDIIEGFDGEGETLTAWCEARRKDARLVRQSFSVTDAKKAGLWGKPGPWTQYPKRMLQMRARSWALRDAFPDVLRGLTCYEEALDIPRGEQNWTGPTIDAIATPPGNVPPGEQNWTGPTDTSNGDLRDQINAAVPMGAPRAEPRGEAPIPPRRTVRAFLAMIHDRLSACTSPAEVEAVATLPEVVAALNPHTGLINGALDELNAILADAMERFAEVAADETPLEDDIFPGDRPAP